MARSARTFPFGGIAPSLEWVAQYRRRISGTDG
jgi:methylenetetrahydrofolate reductase (NADPH)